MRVCECVCVCESVCVCVCVRERESVSVCKRERGERVCVFVCAYVVRASTQIFSHLQKLPALLQISDKYLQKENL